MIAAPDPKPSFIVIGAVKAATTWIAHQLREHPAVFLPGPEPHYFSDQFHRGDEWYRNWFAHARPGATLGEKSADYLAHPHAAIRIARALPDARLIAQLRNPIERAYSDYCMLFRRGSLRDAPESYLSGGESARHRFLNDGLYTRHLSRYFDFFPQDQLAIVLHDDIATVPAAVIARVCDHIGLAPNIDTVRIAARKNDGSAPMLPLLLRRTLRPLKPLARPLRSSAWFRGLHARFSRPIAYPPLTPDLRARLADFYRDDVTQLSRIIGRDLSFWLQSPEYRRVDAQ